MAYGWTMQKSPSRLLKPVLNFLLERKREYVWSLYDVSSSFLSAFLL